MTVVADTMAGERSDTSSPRVLHVITRMIVGGAQENTMLSCALVDGARFPSEILSGPETGLEGELHGETRERGVTLHLEPSLRRAIHPVHDLVALVRLIRFFRKGRYAIVHTHSSKAGILGRIAERLAGVPFVVHTVHGWSFSSGQSPFVRGLYVFLERACAGLCHALIVVGTPDRVEGLELAIGRPAQYHLIRSGIEVEAYRDVAVEPAEVRASIGIPEGAFVIGSVGRLSPQKAPLDLAGAFVHVARRFPHAHLVYVGDGPLRAELADVLRREGLEDRVHFLGLRRDVPALLRAFDVFALSSRWEGLPRVFPQAMAAGLPIVATRVNGAPDAVEEGVNGWLVDPGDIEALAERIGRLAGEPTQAKEMGARGLERIDEFSARRMVDRLSDLYASLTEGSRSR